MRTIKARISKKMLEQQMRTESEQLVSVVLYAVATQVVVEHTGVNQAAGVAIS
jgi:hypothetical protein